MSATLQTPTETRTMNGAEIVLQALKDQGVEVIFGYPGGAVLPLYDALFQQNAIRHILVRHEQAAVHAAEGYARSTGKVGVVLVTSGPGATNAVTGLVDALMDSIPVICLTGQVPTHLIGNDAFQEADTTGITRPATKHNYLVKDINKLAATVHEAFYVAKSGRPGPVVIDLPKDILIGKGPYTEAPKTAHRSYRPQTEPGADAIRAAVKLLKGAKRPIVYAGGGVINSGPEASRLLGEFVRMTGMPCTNTLMGLGAYPSTRSAVPRHAGDARDLRGQPGDAWLRRHAEHRRPLRRPRDRAAERLLARLEEDPRRHRPVQHQQERQGGRRHRRRCGARAGGAGRGLEGRSRPAGPRGDGGLVAADRGLARDALPAIRPAGSIIKPQHAVKRLYEITQEMRRETFITTEVGQHQMWAAQYFGFEQPNRWMTRAGWGRWATGCRRRWACRSPIRMRW